MLTRQHNNRLVAQNGLVVAIRLGVRGFDFSSSIGSRCLPILASFHTPFAAASGYSPLVRDHLPALAQSGATPTPHASAMYGRRIEFPASVRVLLPTTCTASVVIRYGAIVLLVTLFVVYHILDVLVVTDPGTSLVTTIGEAAVTSAYHGGSGMVLGKAEKKIILSLELRLRCCRCTVALVSERVVDASREGKDGGGEGLAFGGLSGLYTLHIHLRLRHHVCAQLTTFWSSFPFPADLERAAKNLDDDVISIRDPLAPQQETVMGRGWSFLPAMVKGQKEGEVGATGDVEGADGKKGEGKHPGGEPARVNAAFVYLYSISEEHNFLESIRLLYKYVVAHEGEKKKGGGGGGAWGGGGGFTF